VRERREETDNHGSYTRVDSTLGRKEEIRPSRNGKHGKAIPTGLRVKLAYTLASEMESPVVPIETRVPLRSGTQGGGGASAAKKKKPETATSTHNTVAAVKVCCRDDGHDQELAFVNNLEWNGAGPRQRAISYLIDLERWLSLSMNLLFATSCHFARPSTSSHGSEGGFPAWHSPPSLGRAHTLWLHRSRVGESRRRHANNQLTLQATVEEIAGPWPCRFTLQRRAAAFARPH